MIKKSITGEEAYSKMTWLCSRSEQCRYDIGLKLQRMGLKNADVTDILDRLSEEQYIDDARYARAFCNDKSKFQGWGRAKISYALKQRNIPQSVIDEAIEIIDDDDYTAKLSALLQSKRRSIKNPDPTAVRASLYRFAASRGFETSLIMRCIDKIADETEEYDEL